MKLLNPASPGLGNGVKVRKGPPTGNGILVDGGSIFAGGTTNSGTISALHTGIFLRGIATFTGGVTNSGAISAGGRGIAVGTGSGRRAAGVLHLRRQHPQQRQDHGSDRRCRPGGSVVLGAIVDSGTIVATSQSSHDRAAIHGFTTFNVVGGTWTVSGGGLGWNVDSGAMQVAAGAVLAGMTVSSGGTLAVEFSGSAAGTLVKAGGTEIIEFGGSATGTTVFSGGAIEFVSGGTTAAQLSAGAILAFGAGEVVSGVNVSSGVLLEFLAAAARSAARSARAAS